MDNNLRRKVILPNISSDESIEKFTDLEHGELVVDIHNSNLLFLDENNNVKSIVSEDIIDNKIEIINSEIENTKEYIDNQLSGVVGIQGPQGAQGLKGTDAVGIQGPQGVEGLQGPQGAQGLKGTDAVGTQGPQGAEGLQGPQGAQGLKGTDGKDGTSVTILGTFDSEIELPLENNKNGDGYIIDGNLHVWSGSEWKNVGKIQGPQGAEGLQGPQGAQGLKGTDAVGTQGPQGAEGLQGPQGAQGLKGTDAVGTQGPQGVEGLQGPQGAQGLKGTDAVGTQGPQGAEGLQGPQGAQGLKGTDAVGTQGPQGAEGLQGPQGAQGLKGTDAVGTQGPQGAEGLQGPQGAQGLKGTDAVGTQGPQGALDELSIKSLKTEIYNSANTYTNNQISNLSNTYVSKTELNNKNYLTSIPSEYITETELNNKGYLTQHQDISGKQDTIDDLSTIRSGAALGATALQKVPTEYVTESELSKYSTTGHIHDNRYYTEDEINIKLNDKLDKTAKAVSATTSDNAIKATQDASGNVISTTYATKKELENLANSTELTETIAQAHTHNNKDLLDTYNQTNVNLVDAVNKKHEHSNKSVIDGITSDMVNSWTSKIDSTILNNTLSGYSKTEHTHTTSDITGGTLNIARIPTGTTSTTVSRGDHTHDGRYYTEDEINTKLSGKSDTGHTHDDRYYTESEINTKLSSKSDSGHTHTTSDITGGTLNIARIPTGTTNLTVAIGNHNHEGVYSKTGHTHDDRYYTESEIDTKLSDKANTNHSHTDLVNTQASAGSGALYLFGTDSINIGGTVNYLMVAEAGDFYYDCGDKSLYIPNINVNSDIRTKNLNVTDKINASGDITTTTDVYAESDARLKNIENELEIDFNKIKNIPKVYYYWKNKDNKRHIGTLAQDVQKYYPELVKENEDGILSVSYDKFGIIALSAIDKLHEQNQELKKENEELKKRLENIEKLLNI